MTRRLWIRIDAGPDAGRAHPLGDHAVRIGRGDGEDLQLTDGAVSRHHLTVEALPDGGGVAVLDSSGANPAWTVRAGKRQVIGVGARLAADESITLGNTTLTLTAGEILRGSADPRGTLEMSTQRESTTVDGRAGVWALAALGDQLARCGSLQAVYRTATAWAVDVLPASRALLLSPDGSDILAASTGEPVLDLAISRSLLARVLAEKRAFLVRDVLVEPDLADRRSVQARGIKGAMAAPVANLVFYAEWGTAEAIRGAHGDDTLTLLVCAAQLVGALGESAAERNQLRAVASQSTPAGASLGRIIGGSAAVRRLQVFLERVAGPNATILLNGESGTGKELAASMIHALSERRTGPFVAINCASVPENLLESEFFGHEKGAFTGAVAQHQGVFERAHGGTLFLDEVAEMSAATQARMLRVLETRSFTRVGGTRDIHVDVRLVAATHADLRARVDEGRFREDLFYRLSVIQTRLPPLRERMEDIPALVEHFAASLGAAMGRNITHIAPAALDILQRYRWPGNIRELRNVVERALVLGDGNVLEPDDLPPELQHAAPPGEANVDEVEPARIVPLAEVEARAIEHALQATAGNKARAAALLGIDRTTLYRKLKELDPGGP